MVGECRRLSQARDLTFPGLRFGPGPLSGPAAPAVHAGGPLPSAWLACQGPRGPFQVAFLFKDAGLWAVGLGEMAQHVIIW